MIRRVLVRPSAPTALAMLLALALAPARAQAQQEVGVRAGVSADPDQFYIGAHLQTRPLVDRVHFRPNLEIGFGNDLTVVAANLEFVYRFALPAQGWDAYAGGGPCANFIRFSGARQGSDGVEPGFTIVAGIAHRDGLFTEFKVGAMDSPSVKFGVGYAWR